MSRQSLTAVRSQSGFTLVELAVVMIIIGLLIGGVLKGQELISNAQVTATVAQLKGIEAATTTFRDTYSAMPGDMLRASDRLPNCTEAPCNIAGNGNGRIDNTPAAAPANTNEGGQYFVHLNAADLLTGIVPTAGSYTAGTNLPGAKISNAAIQVGYASQATQLTGAIDNAGASAGHYLVIVGAPGDITATSNGLKPTEALRIDSKLDDGAPGRGSVRAVGGTTCGSATLYNTASADAACALYVRTQS